MSKITPYEAYIKYLAVQMHFKKDSYDYFRYNGKVTASFTKFDSRPDKYKFKKLADYREIEDHLVANMAINPNIWVGTLLEETAIARGKCFTRTRNSLTYAFEKDILSLDTNFKSVFVSEKKGDYPPLLTLYMNSKVDLATLAILERLLGYTKLWNKRIDDSVLWPNIRNRIIKVFPFYHVQVLDKYKSIFMKHFSIN